MMESSGAGGIAVYHGTDDKNDDLHLPLSPTSKKEKKNDLSFLFNQRLDEIPALTISLFSQWKDRITIDTLRPLPAFFGITGPSFCLSPKAYTAPFHLSATTTHHLFDSKDKFEKIKQRMGLNTTYFLTNYVLIFVGTGVVIALLHPIMIMFIIIIGLLWKTHFIMIEHPDLTFGIDIKSLIPGVDTSSSSSSNLGNYFSVERRTNILYFISILFGLFFCLVPLFMVLIISGLLIGLHAMMRDPKHIESSATSGIASFHKRGGDADSDTDSGGSEVLVEKSDVV